MRGAVQVFISSKHRELRRLLGSATGALPGEAGRPQLTALAANTVAN
jgi:hypothetical protein